MSDEGLDNMEMEPVHMTAKTGEMVSTTGVCRFCGQYVSIEIPKDSTEEECNKEASAECTCPGANNERAKQQKIAAAIEFVNNLTNKYAAALLRVAISACMQDYIRQVTVKDKALTYIVFVDAKGDIRIKTKRVKVTDDMF